MGAAPVVALWLGALKLALPLGLALVAPPTPPYAVPFALLPCALGSASATLTPVELRQFAVKSSWLKGWLTNVTSAH